MNASQSNNRETVLVTGGLGYIGSHASVSLMEQGFDVVVLDNLSNSTSDILDRIESITSERPTFFNVDLRDKNELKTVFDESSPDVVMHFAAKKSVSESVNQPISYYENNVTGTLNLLKIMSARDLKKIVFSSSATVYGNPEEVPIPETAPLKPINPYGRSKYVNELQLKDLHRTDPSWEVMILRYFNPVGAHESGKIGEDPSGKPENLMPVICNVAAGEQDVLEIYGDDYDTPDGTGVRDYIHIIDLVEGHVRALELMNGDSGYNVYNLGTGEGYSVKEMVNTFERVTGQSIPVRIADRRQGDVGVCYADPSKAKRELNWETKRNLKDMCRDAWNWRRNARENSTSYE